MFDQGGNKLDDPEFVLHDPASDSLILAATDQLSAGKYMVMIEATLDNVLRSQESISFILNVSENLDTDYSQSLLPAPLVDLFVHN